MNAMAGSRNAVICWHSYYLSLAVPALNFLTEGSPAASSVVQIALDEVYLIPVSFF